MNLAVENWKDFLLGTTAGWVTMAIIALIVVKIVSKWK